VKGRAILDYVYHPDRLKYPLKRVGERGNGTWQRISWGEATDIIAQRLTAIRKENGPEAVAMATGTRSADVTQTSMVFIRYFGSPNACGAGMAQCFHPREKASTFTYGGWLFPDFEGGAKLVVMWGAQTYITSPDHYTAGRLFYALRQGAKLIVVDPRRTRMAARADMWQALRPGTDAALVLFWLNAIINEGLYDKKFVEKWTNAPYLVCEETNQLLVEADLKQGGDSHSYMVWDTASKSVKRAGKTGTPAFLGSFEAGGIRCQPVWQRLKDRVDEYSPEKVAEITFVPADQIRAAARMYAKVRPSILLWGVAIEQQIGSHQIARAICILESLCNNIDVPGGMADMRPSPGWDGRVGGTRAWGTIPKETQDKLLGGATYGLLKETCTGHIPTLKKAILEDKPYPVRALLIWGSNPMMSWADTSSTFEVLKKVEFSVVCDLFMTPTAQLADIVLPAASFLEKNRISQGLTNNRTIIFLRKLIEPLGECRDEFDIAGEIIRKCGLGKSWPWNSIEEFYEEELKRKGLGWYQYKDKGWFEGKVQYKKYETDYYRKGGGFATPTGKIELFSTKWRELGYDPLPFHQEQSETPYSSPVLTKEYPYILITGGRLPMFFHSELRQVQKLRRIHPEPIVQIHPRTAKALDITDGDWAWIETLRGKCKQKVKLFDGMDPGIVHIEHDWWFPEKTQGEPSFSGAFESNANMLTSCEERFIDPGHGGYTLRALLCKVYKV